MITSKAYPRARRRIAANASSPPCTASSDPFPTSAFAPRARRDWPRCHRRSTQIGRRAEHRRVCAGRAPAACRRPRSSKMSIPRPPHFQNRSFHSSPQPVSLEMVKPRPVPPYLRVVDASACEKALNSAACTAGGIPIPVSRTANLIVTLSGIWASTDDANCYFAAVGKFQSVSDQIVQNLTQPIGSRRTRSPARRRPLARTSSRSLL